MSLGKRQHVSQIHDEQGSEDSFLDVVANVVGVLIILVMLVGAQAARSVFVIETVKTPPEEKLELPMPEIAYDLDQLRSGLEQAERAALQSQRAVRDLNSRIVRISHESEAYNRQRVELAMHRSVLEEDLQRRQELLDERKQREFDVQRRLLETKLNLDELTQEQFSLISAPATVTEIECVPTPLARVVEGKSIHLRVSKGLVSVVPFERLMEEVQYNIDGALRRLQDRGMTVETYGPIDGYRLKFTVAKQAPRNSVGGPIAGQFERVKIGWEAEIIPVSAEIGQNVEQSLLPGGVLQQHLMSLRRENPAVVVWLYTDSFDEFRLLKRALWEMGFSLATRPMKPGVNIKASPAGTRAAAQ